MAFNIQQSIFDKNGELTPPKINKKKKRKKR